MQRLPVQRHLQDLRYEIDPSGIEQAYLHRLNECFGNYGDELVFDWVFKRPLATNPTSTILVVKRGQSLIAGSALNYRTLKMSCGCKQRVGIMTSSWTKPEERGNGHFMGFIRRSIEVAQARECGALLAFVAESNASSRQLRAAGALMCKSFYLRHASAEGANDGRIHDEVSLSEVSVSDLSLDINVSREYRNNYLRFDYPDMESWLSQFVLRPWPIRVFMLPSGHFSIVEEHGTTDRINTINASSPEARRRMIVGLLQRNKKLGRTLFLYSTLEREADFCAQLGFEIIPGYIAMIPWQKSQQPTAKTCTSDSLPCSLELIWNSSVLPEDMWRLESGDRL